MEKSEIFGLKKQVILIQDVSSFISSIDFLDSTKETIIIYAGEILEGIFVDGKMFGIDLGPHTINIASDEPILLSFGYHTHE